MPSQPNIGSIVPKRPESFIPQKFKELQQQIDELRTARTGNAMTVDGKPGISLINGGNLSVNDGGSVTVNDGGALAMNTPSGQAIFAIKQEQIPDGSGRTQQTLHVRRDNGQTVLYVGDYGVTPGHPHQQNWALLDRAGNGIFAEDTVSGVGIAAPTLQLCAWANLVQVTGTAPVPTTTSASWTGVQWGDTVQIMPKAQLCILAYADGGAVGQARVTVGGVQMGSIVTINAFTNIYFPVAAWPSGTYTWQGRATLQLEIRRTSGTGNIGAAGMGLVGAGS